MAPCCCSLRAKLTAYARYILFLIAGIALKIANLWSRRKFHWQISLSLEQIAIAIRGDKVTQYYRDWQECPLPLGLARTQLALRAKEASADSRHLMMGHHRWWEKHLHQLDVCRMKH